MPCMGCSTGKHAVWNHLARCGVSTMPWPTPTEAPRLSQAAAQLKDQAPEMKVRDSVESSGRSWFFLSVFQEWEPVEKVGTVKDFHTRMPCCLVFFLVWYLFWGWGGGMSCVSSMLWKCEYWGPQLAGNDAMISTSLGGVSFWAWIRKCLAPWWPLFKCTKKWWHYWSRVGRIPTTNTLVSMFDFWVYNDISPRALLFSNGWLLVWGPVLRVRNNEPLADVKRSCWKIASLKLTGLHPWK